MKSVFTIAMFLGIAVVIGCGGQQPADQPKPKPKTGSTVVTTDAKPAESTDNDHSGWWCDEHGVPEAECSMCQGDVFKKLKPDELCKNHPDRAKAQCFICNPDLRAKYAAVYRAKYDKDPPEPSANMPEKK